MLELLEVASSVEMHWCASIADIVSHSIPFSSSAKPDETGFVRDYFELALTSNLAWTSSVHFSISSFILARKTFHISGSPFLKVTSMSCIWDVALLVNSGRIKQKCGSGKKWKTKKSSNGRPARCLGSVSLAPNHVQVASHLWFDNFDVVCGILNDK